MNNNGQVVVAGLFLLTTMAVAMVAVGMFEVPTFEPEAKPIVLLELKTDEALFSPAPIELLGVNTDATLFSPAPIEFRLQYTGDTEQGLTPEQIYHGVTAQALAQARSVTKIQTHSGVCSGRY